MTSGIGGPSPTPEGIPGLSASGDNKNVEQLLDTKVKNLGQLKAAMIKSLGEKDGMKLYNQFMNTFGIQMITQLQQASDEAAQAAKKMGGQPS